MKFLVQQKVVSISCSTINTENTLYSKKPDDFEMVNNFASFLRFMTAEATQARELNTVHDLCQNALYS